MADTAVSLVCYDLASLVIDGTVVERSFAEAIATQGIVPGTEAYTRAMVRLDRAAGCPPADVLRGLFADDELRAQAACLAFDRSFKSAGERFGITVPPETLEVLGKTAAAGVGVCLLCTLSREACGAVLDWLGRQADLMLFADDAPRGFPWPDPVLTAMLRLRADSVRQVAMVSATRNGVLSGQRAGLGLIVGVAGGSRAAAPLRKAGATHIIDEITALPALLAAGT